MSGHFAKKNMSKCPSVCGGLPGVLTHHHWAPHLGVFAHLFRKMTQNKLDLICHFLCLAYVRTSAHPWCRLGWAAHAHCTFRHFAQPCDMWRNDANININKEWTCRLYAFVNVQMCNPSPRLWCRLGLTFNLALLAFS